jgi:4-alpha-glucanotransferase
MIGEYRMKFGAFDHFFTGISVPVFALRSETSCGIGDFSDLELLGKWCAQCGFEIIQILPVNDTGYDSSPYSALSAIALHPIYIKLEDLDGAQKFSTEIEAFRVTYENKPRLFYRDVLDFKLDILSKIFSNNKKQLINNIPLKKWIEKNPWIKPYAIFYNFKKKYNFHHWKSWPVMQNPTEEDIEKFWEDYPEDSYFHSWVQFNLENQLIRSSKQLEKKGIYLKGDIPILLNKDSVDIWMYRKYFDLNFTAGAPPDMFSNLGQNWDFPVFNWEAMEEDDFSWWRMRLKQADKFYHCYRIDHVLGFFRIFRIPETDTTGRLGYFYPSQFITKAQLRRAGFHAARVKWMSDPHIKKEEIIHLTGDKAEHVIKTYMVQLNNENLYNFKPEVEGERNIEELDEDEGIKKVLLQWHRDRTLLQVGKDKYHHLWNYNETRAFNSLHREEQKSLEEIITSNEKKSESIWAKQGIKLLSMMKDTTDMLMCAEDLGVVPECVPEVLKQLSILSLKIERWTREWEKPDQPYIPVTKYPRLSVCTPSVHDTSTLRGWWILELNDSEKNIYLKNLRLRTKNVIDYTQEIAEKIIKYHLGTNSIFCIFQIQDIFSLFQELQVINPDDERINVPGTVSEKNWSYRIYSTLEFLINYDKFNDYLTSLLQEREKRILREKSYNK